MKPKISIITVTYNSEKYLEECISSIVSQNYSDLEYIIIDGGSTDNTLNIINRYKQYISYFVSEPDNGISDAFNKGLKKATGDIIGIINSDDVMFPNVLQKLSQLYEDDIDIYRGYCEICDENLNKIYILHPNQKFHIPPIGAKVCHESSFITKRLYDKIGLYKEHLHFTMDLDLFIRAYRNKDLKSKFIDLCVIKFRKGGASSSSYSKLKDERKRLILENGGTMFDVSVFLIYHKVKFILKKLFNR